jgi:periplasmic divalent cation tolerance protein
MIRTVLCNCDPEQTESLANRLIDQDLAACVNVFTGTRSIYVWEDEVCDGTEDTLLIKTAEETYPEMKDKLLAWHSYDTPEVIALKPEDVSEDYARWVVSETTE